MLTILLRSRRVAATGVALAAIASLAACGSDSATESSDAAFNESDVTFATDMIPHHAQAVHMAEMVEGKQVSPEVAELAADIKGAQDPEIEQMSTWLDQWGEPVPDISAIQNMDMTDPSSMEGMDMEGMDMAGMMSSDDMSDLAAADGPTFDRLWLEGMIAHHEGAIEMAQVEQDSGEYEPALELAAEIEAAQANEIAVMKDLLSSP